MRDAVREAFPQMEEVADPPTVRFRIPAGLDGIFQAPTAEEFAALRAAADQFRQSGATARAGALAGFFLTSVLLLLYYFFVDHVLCPTRTEISTGLCEECPLFARLACICSTGPFGTKRTVKISNALTNKPGKFVVIVSEP